MSDSSLDRLVRAKASVSDHITELNNQRPKQPFFFLKPPSSLLLPRDGPVLAPRGATLHYEVELGLIIGRTLRNHDPEDEEGAMASISDYLLAIDMTARNVQDEAKKKGLPWSIAKGFDTFCPISDVIPKHRLPDPYQGHMSLSVDGQVKQSDKAELMLFRIPRILADISAVMALEEGDIVLTGTPKGVGQVRAGQSMSAKIEAGGKELQEGRIEVDVVDKGGRYEFKET